MDCEHLLEMDLELILHSFAVYLYNSIWQLGATQLPRATLKMCTTHSFDTFAEVLVSPSSPFAQSYKNPSVSLWDDPGMGGRETSWRLEFMNDSSHLDDLLANKNPWDAIPFRFPRIKVQRLPFFWVWETGGVIIQVV